MGGTYIDQFTSDGIDMASEEWAKRKLNDPILGELNEGFFIEYLNQVVSKGFVEIDGTKGVWPFYFEFNGNDAWGHFILGPKIHEPPQN